MTLLGGARPCSGHGEQGVLLQGSLAWMPCKVVAWYHELVYDRVIMMERVAKHGKWAG
jgi:hypothetical protein